MQEEPPPRWIYLSPHFDDAVLSCGGLIWEQTQAGTPVEIWTICAGYPPPGSLSDFARATHALWGTAGGRQTVRLRMGEDRQAAGLVGALPVHFDLPDCIYRRSPQGQVLYPATVVTELHPAEQDLPQRLASRLAAGLHPADRLVCPLALGGHVDHGLVRRSAEMLGRPLQYYADVPYLLNNPQILAESVSVLESKLYPVSERGLAAWLRGVSAYHSQIDSLYAGVGTLDQSIRGYWAAGEGLRLWYPR